MVTDKGRLGVMVERFELYGGVKGFGVLRFAQDDSKDEQRQRQRQLQLQGQHQRQLQPQIPPLRYGMTNKKTNNGNGKSNGNGDMLPGRGDITRRRG
jgi:hypothetical protein